MRDNRKAMAKVLQSLNKHLPSKRRRLSELLEEDKPRVGLKDGSTHRLKREELEQIAEIVPQSKHHLVRLPLYIEMVSEHGRGSGRIRGYLDVNIVQTILDLEQDDSEEILLYSPDVRKLRRKLPTTTQYAFFVSLD